MKHQGLKPKTLKRNLLLFLIIMALGLFNLKAQTTLYSVDFEDLDDGTDSTAYWTTDASGASPDRFGEYGGNFEAKYLQGEGVWTSSKIVITGYPTVDVSLLLKNADKMEAGDYLRIYYKLNNGPETLFETNGNLSGNFSEMTASQNNLAGDTLQIVIRVSNDAGDENHEWDDIVVIANDGLYSEDFESYSDGVDSTAKWTLDVSAATPDRFEVRAGKFEAKYTQGEAIWISSVFSIAGYSNTNVSVLLYEADKMESDDYIRIYYKLDGGKEVLFETNGNLAGNFLEQYATQKGLIGDSLQIMIKVSNNAGDEDHKWDDITVEGNNYMYFEDFADYANGTTTSSKWSIDVSAANPNRFRVEDNAFECKDIDGEAVWTSSLIDISDKKINLSADLSEEDIMESTDYIRIYYKLDNGSEQLFETNGDMTGEFSSAIATQSNLTGDSLRIIIRVSNDDGHEIHRFDNVGVSGITLYNRWTGNQDTLWNNSANWQFYRTPVNTDSVIIPANVMNQPVITVPSTVGDLYLAGNATLTFSGTSTLNVYRDFNCWGDLIHGNSTIKFVGDTEQLISSDSAITFYNFQLDNNSGISSDQKIVINNNIEFIQGTLDIGNDTLVITSNEPSSITVSGDDSYVIGAISRKIKGTGGNNYEFPLGTASAGSSRAKLNFSTVPGDSDVTLTGTFVDLANPGVISFTERVTDNDCYFTGGSQYLEFNSMVQNYGYWKFNPDGPKTGWSYDFYAFPNISKIMSDNSSLTHLKIIKAPSSFSPGPYANWSPMLYHSGDWCDGVNIQGGSMVWIPGPYQGFAATDSIRASGLTSFSSFGMGGSGGAALPIELLNFDAVLINDKVKLYWNTATEINNHYFTVERSSDGTDFKEVTRVKGAGNSATTLSYETVDEDPLSGVSYYRLKQTDFDRNFSYSHLVSVNNQRKSGSENIIIFPNPTDGQLKIKVNIPSEFIEIVVFNQNGNISFVKSLTNKNGIVQLDLTKELVPGVYYLQIKAGSSMSIERFVLQ